MNQTATLLEKDVSALKAVIIYDCLALAAKANHILQNVASHGGVEWEVTPWRSQLLRSANLGASAHGEAEDAHLIVIAPQNHQFFPAWLEQWMQKWAAGRKVENAAVAVLSDDPQTQAAFSARLSRLASRERFNFISDVHSSGAAGYACAG